MNSTSDRLPRRSAKPRGSRRGRAAHGKDEGDAVPFAIGVVHFGEVAELRRRQLVEPGARLLAPRFLRQVAGDRRLAGEVGVGEEQRPLAVLVGMGNGVGKCGDHRVPRRKRPPLRGLRGDPGRMLGDVAERFDEGVLVHAVHVVEGNREISHVRQILRAWRTFYRFRRNAPSFCRSPASCRSRCRAAWCRR